MKTEDLKTIGTLIAKATNGLFDILIDKPKFDDALAKKLSDLRKSIFPELVPLIKQYHALPENVRDEKKSEIGFAYVDLLPSGIEEKSEQVNKFLDTIPEDCNPELIMDIQGLYAGLGLLMLDDFENYPPEVLEHLGF